jgi:glycosyltransferase involved in cell wall biosynthesis
MIDSLARILEEEQERVRPEFSWVEWGLCGAVMARSRPRQPWVYAHHDWAHRLAGVRAKISGRAPPLSDRLCEYNMQKTEHWIARQATAVVSGSATEAREMEMIGCSNCYVIPTAYEAAPPPGFSARPLLPLRIVHLGALSTTANYAGLQSYLTKVHPMVQEEFAKNKLQPPELSIIGDTSRAKPKLLDQLRAAGATIHGHVTDLSTVLRPFDVAIIPYEQNTGTRTKLSLLFNHAQMVLATAQSVAGSKEIQPGENCLVVSDLSEFPRALLEVARNGSYREALGRAARALFEERFTYAAQQPLFAQVLQSLNPDPVRSSAELCQI